MEDQIAGLIEMLNALSNVKFSLRIILHVGMHLLPYSLKTTSKEYITEVA